MPDAINATQRRVWFTPTVSGEIRIAIEATGLSTPDTLVIVKSSAGNVDNGSVVLTCEKGKRISLTLEFDNGYTGPIEISAFHITQITEAAV